MANQEDVDHIVSMAEQTEDVEQLKKHQQELMDIAATMDRIASSSTDQELRDDALAIKESAEYSAQDIGQRARQLQIDQMDPNYERRKAERAAFEQQQKEREAREAQEGLSKLSGFFGGLMGGGSGGGGGAGGLGALFGGGAQQAQPAAGGAAAPAAMACASCGRPIEGSPKFCPNCGAATQRSCKSCGQPIEGSPKFCPNCGTPTA
jgi:rubrerythrin